MKLKFTNLVALAATIIASGLLAEVADGAVMISNWNATTSTLSFNVTGSITDNNPGASQIFRIFIGMAGGTGDWATNATNLSGSILDNGGSTAPLHAAWIFTFHNGAVGVQDTIQLETNNPSFSLGDVFNYSIAYVGIQGDATLIDFNQVIVSWGRTNFDSAPEVAHQIGSAIPEPSSTILLGLGALGVVACRRRANN